jgi:hypothetical protein
VAASYQRLVPTLEAMRSLLRSEEESFFADWIDKDIALLRREDPEGVRRFLAAFGGDGKSQRRHVLTAGRRPGRTVARGA